MQTQERNQSVGKLLKFRNQVNLKIDNLSQDFDGLELLIRTHRRSYFIQNEKFNFYLYRFE